MNEVMKMLSLIATVMLPLSFLTGLYGMNFIVLPGAKHPAGFWILVVIMLIFVAASFGYFKKKQWI
jgi:magnesium transporter